MKLGLLVESEEGLDWESWRRTYATAERLGFESVWISDHLASPWSTERHGLEPWVALSVAAAETARVRLGTLVSPITFRQPSLVARTAEAIDLLSDGRFVLGLGLGWNADEHRRFGIPFPAVAERMRLLSDGIERIREVLGERHVPVLIGGAGPRATLPIVARHADEWNLTTASVEFFLARSQRLAEICAEIGRDHLAIRRSVAVGFLIGRNPKELRQRCQRMQALVPPLAQVAVDEVPGAAAEMGWVAGSPQQLTAALRPLAQAGVDLAILGHYDLQDVAALEMLAEDVLPALA
jgi:alkanesulfonate monooxygenase SsuD/methylene tetrahydromethanopterin reductase-like flavin-dependent oxidoreductase (luciferase family)